MQDKNDFELSTLPALVPVLSAAAGETLLLLVKRADLIISKTSQEHLISHVLPLIVRAYEDNDARVQEEVLRKSAALAKQLDVQLVKQAILPRVHGLALKTTVAAVRVNALLCLAELVNTLDKHAVLDILQTIQRCTAVDRSAPTLMCTLGIANSILKQYGVDFVTEHVLSMLIPLLTAPQLNVQQFAKYMFFVKDILRKIEEKRGVVTTDSGITDMKLFPNGDGSKFDAQKKANIPIAPTIKNSPSWDEDWGPTKQGAKFPTSSSSPSLSIGSSSQQNQLTANVERNNVISSLSKSSTSTVHLSQESSQSVASVDIEWPPRASSGFTSSIGTETQSQNPGPPLSSSSEDFDPFADWPPRPTGFINGTAPSSNTISWSNNASSQINSMSSWGLGSQAHTLHGQTQVGATPVGGSPNNIGMGSSQIPIGFMKQNQGIATSSSSSYDKKQMGIASVFGSAKSDQQHSALRLAPPPTTAVGRGRGVSQSRPTHAKSASDQPPLLDLL
uniref:SCY1-like protein 2 n=1 Tax=Kalanchoe fedtschenkoi TaxID=63787 RepID=A0A7N0UCA6_KALFE